ncbi:MAG: twin-arginine translocation signal domain-containing protein, partial [Kiritimatiellae bacterium]|nr:twin-arginine translocation signal domain-containing protein [Kiritimatiellia bacterium]
MKENSAKSAITRRQFLKKTVIASAAVAVPYIIPASALCKDGAVAPSEQIGLGAIGIGGRGSYDLGCMLKETDVHCIA